MYSHDSWTEFWFKTGHLRAKASPRFPRLAEQSSRVLGFRVLGDLGFTVSGDLGFRGLGALGVLGFRVKGFRV